MQADRGPVEATGGHGRADVRTVRGGDRADAGTGDTAQPVRRAAAGVHRRRAGLRPHP